MTHPIVENIRKIISDRKISQKAMAAYAGTSASQFSKILSGEVQLSLRQISNIATNIGLREIDLFTRISMKNAETVKILVMKFVLRSLLN